MPYPTTSLLTPDISEIRKGFSPYEQLFVSLSDFYFGLGYPVGHLSPSEHVARVLSERFPAFCSAYLEPSVRLFPDGDDSSAPSLAIINLSGDVQMRQFKPNIVADAEIRGHLLNFLESAEIGGLLGVCSFSGARDFVLMDLLHGYDSLDELKENEPELYEESYGENSKPDPSTVFNSDDCFQPASCSLNKSVAALARFGIAPDILERAKVLTESGLLKSDDEGFDDTPIEPWLISSFPEPVGVEWDYLESRHSYVFDNFGVCYSSRFLFNFDSGDALLDAYRFDQIVSEVYTLCRMVSNLMEQVIQPYRG